MPHIHSISVSKEVSDLLDKLYHGQKSRVCDEALRSYFDLNPDLKVTRERKPTQEKYPPLEITIDDL